MWSLFLCIKTLHTNKETYDSCFIEIDAFYLRVRHLMPQVSFRMFNSLFSFSGTHVKALVSVISCVSVNLYDTTGHIELNMV